MMTNVPYETIAFELENEPRSMYFNFDRDFFFLRERERGVGRIKERKKVMNTSRLRRNVTKMIADCVRINTA